jgi:hypothetical protein
MPSLDDIVAVDMLDSWTSGDSDRVVLKEN